MKKKVTYNQNSIKRSTLSNPHSNGTYNTRLDEVNGRVSNVKIVQEGYYWKFIKSK